MTIQGPNLKLDYNQIQGQQSTGAQVANVATSVASGLLSALLSGGGAKELSDSGVRTTLAEGEKTATIADFAQQKSACAEVLTKIAEMVQDGTLNISDIQNALSAIFSTIEDANASAEAIKEEMDALRQENEEIMNEISELNNDPNNLVNIKMGNEEDNNQSDENNFQVNNNNPNYPKIQELMEKLNKNNEIIESLNQNLIAISVQQQQSVSEGQGLQSSAETLYNTVMQEVQQFAQEKFSELGSKVKTAMTKGAGEQEARTTEATTYEGTDLTASTMKAAEATAAGAGSFFTFGATSGIAAKAAADAAAFEGASVINGTNIGKAVANLAAIKAGEQTVGQFLSSQISDMVYQAFEGAIKETTNQILGEDVASYVNPLLQGMIEKPDENNA